MEGRKKSSPLSPFFLFIRHSFVSPFILSKRLFHFMREAVISSIHLGLQSTADSILLQLLFTFSSIPAFSIPFLRSFHFFLFLSFTPFLSLSFMFLSSFLSLPSFSFLPLRVPFQFLFCSILILTINRVTNM